jgi:hypothetical protein
METYSRYSNRQKVHERPAERIQTKSSATQGRRGMAGSTGRCTRRILAAPCNASAIGQQQQPRTVTRYRCRQHRIPGLSFPCRRRTRPILTPVRPIQMRSHAVVPGSAAAAHRLRLCVAYAIMRVNRAQVASVHAISPTCLARVCHPNQQVEVGGAKAARRS